MPVIDHWWQTETGWAIAANPIGHRAAAGPPGLADRAHARLRRADPGRGGRGAAGRPDGRDLHPAAAAARAACRRCGTPTSATARPISARYPGWYLTGDAGYKDADGYLYIMSRIDDVINVAGHRLSTGGMEEVLASHTRRRRVRGDRRRRPAQGRAAAGPGRAQGRRRPATRQPIRQELVAKVRDRDRPGRGVQAGGRGQPPAQDPLRQDPARHHEEARRRQPSSRSRPRSTTR